MPGTNRVQANVPPFEPQIVDVLATATVIAPAEVPAVAIVTNTRKLGSLDVVKTVEWNEITKDTNKHFEICIQGLSFPKGTENGACKSVGFEGGTLAWTQLVPGTYIVSETDPGLNEWEIIFTSANPAVVANNGTKATVNVKNRTKNVTAVSLIYFKLKSINGLEVNLEWKTGAEIHNWGYNLYRSATPNRANAILEPRGSQLAIDGHTPGTYFFPDTLANKQPAYYWLVDVDFYGKETFHGPVGVLENKIFIPAITH